MRALVFAGVTLLLLTACADEETPERERPAKSSSRTKRATPVAPAPVADPPTPSEAPPPAPPPISTWWCVCYQAAAEAGPQPATSCRELESECHNLEKRIAKGGRGLVTASVSHACRQITAEHPGDSLGGRDRWQPSKRAGAWTSEGECLLEGAPAQEIVDPTDADNGFHVLMHEALGELRIGMDTFEIKQMLGEPTQKGEIEQSQASGDFEQTWEYPDAGLTLYMSAASRHDPQSLGSLRASSPCTRKTRRGVGIGSDWEAVEKAYRDVRDEESLDPDDKSVFTAGSVYGGVFFYFEADKVTSIFMGAGAE